MGISADLDNYLLQSIEQSLGLPVPEKTMRVKLESLEASNDCLRGQVLILERRLREKSEKLRLSMEEASCNAQGVKRQITMYQKYVDENIVLNSAYQEILEKYEEAKQESELLERDRDALMEFGDEAAERAKEAETRADQAEERSGKILDELVSLKKECEVLKEKEAKMLEELSSLSKSDDDCSERVGNGSESEVIRCIRCASLAKEKKDLHARLADVVLNKDLEALIAQVKMLEEEKELLRLNLKGAEEEVIILSDENCRLEEKNKSLSKKCKRKQRDCSNGTQSKSISTKSKRECKSKIGKVFDARVLDFNDSESPRQPLLPIQNNSPESRSSKK